MVVRPAASDRSHPVVIAATGISVALALYAGSYVSSGVVMMVALTAAVFVSAVIVGLIASYGVENVLAKRLDGGPSLREAVMPRPLRRRRPCSLCGGVRTSAGAAWLCPTCDVGVPA